jgi:crossover junction endodeoxyribonuclease RuvC
MRILGVDPGSRLTGYGCIDASGNQIKLVDHGTLKIANTHGKATVPLEDRLLLIYQGLSEVIQRLRPQIMVVEKVFFAKNALSALKLGQARGAVVLTGKIHSLQIVEYNPTQVKQAVVGYGQADKEQVAKMVQLIVGRQNFDTPDASDGVALAICHSLFIRNLGKSASSYELALQSGSSRRSKKRMSLAESLGIKLSELPAAGKIKT